MLSALGIGGKKKRWTPAAKLQKDGKVSKKAVLEYLEFGAQQLASAESIEEICRLRNRLKDESECDKIGELINDWQCQLIEHRGWEVMFGRTSIGEWQQVAGTPGHAKSDPTVCEAFHHFQMACQMTMECGMQLCRIRGLLQLGDDGKVDSESLMPRRTPATDQKLQTVGPIQKSKIIKFCELARDLVMASETREQLGKLLVDYATWKQEKQIELMNVVILNWQHELWDSAELCVDRRLGMIDLMRCVPQKGQDDLIHAQKEMLMACQALSLWVSPRPHKDSLPRAEGRRYEPMSLVDEASKEDMNGVICNGGVMAPEKFIKVLRKLLEVLESEDHGKAVEEAAFASEPADLRAAERLCFELNEAVGVEHRYFAMLLVYHGANEEVLEIAGKIAEAHKKVKAGLMLGLRRLQEEKKSRRKEAAGGGGHRREDRSSRWLS
jgi:hypothetical protein